MRKNHKYDCIVFLGIKSSFSLFLLFLCGVAIPAPHTPFFLIKENSIDVARPTGALQTIELSRKVEKDDVKFEDLNFDGHLDLKILKERGANQEFYDVYLYSKGARKYIYSKVLSGIPCISADATHREIIGACFHESSCENWEEHYSLTASGKLSLNERIGAYCDPTGDVYTYVDRFKDGKKVSSKIQQLKEDKK
jgi:hypothetical protein